MPRKKKVTRVASKRGRPTKAVISRRTTRKSEKKSGINWTESYSSFLLGVVVVIVAILFGVTIIRQQSHIQQTTSLSTGPTPTVSPTPGTTISENGKTYYVVKQNDSLWNIAVTVYNDGYKWTEIAKANNLANPSTIFTGDKLLLPNAPTPSELGQMMGNTQTDKITTGSYTVKKDDTLWEIAVRAYGDGYKWTEIAKANNLANPDYIFSGNVLTLPR
jgi:putative chitinase